MSADLVNLRLARKRRAREQAEREAAENRVRHGRAKATKAADAAEHATLARRLDGHRLTPDE